MNGYLASALSYGGGYERNRLPLQKSLSGESTEKGHLIMKTLMEIYREGRFFITQDLLTRIARQGLT